MRKIKKKGKLFFARYYSLRKVIAIITAAAVVFIAASFFLAKHDAIPAQLSFTGERLVPIYYVETQEKKVAFSFDACWGGSTILRTESRGTIMLPPPGFAFVRNYFEHLT